MISCGVVGTISTNYLDYFTGVVEKLPHDNHYVIWKSGDNEYTLAYSEDLSLNGTTFSGSDCDVVQIYRESNNYNTNWLVRTISDDVQVSSTNLFIYSDLGMYSTVERGLSGYEGMAILFAIVFATIFSVCNRIFSSVLQFRNKK